MNQTPDPSGKTPIEPTVAPALQQDLLDRLLATRERDLEEVEAAHRLLLEASPALHRQLLRWLAAHEPASLHLAVGLAILATGPDPEARRFVVEQVAKLPLLTLADLVDFIHGWQVDRKLVKMARQRFQDEMTAAYAVSADVVREELERSSGARPDEFHGGEILVTLGHYDKVQQVLDHLQLPYRTIPCQAVQRLPLRADQVLIVNCPGEFDADGLEAVRRFVARGGTLITTDWALDTTIQLAFPGFIECTGKSTQDDVVKVSWIHPASPLTHGMDVPGQPISWWLEGASYPIRVLDRRVTVLVRSAEMKEKYEEDPLVVTFDYGEGTVVHLTSHYYLQRSQGDKSAKAGEVAGDPLSRKIYAEAEAGGLSPTQMSAAYSSMRLLANILYESRRQCGV